MIVCFVGESKYKIYLIENQDYVVYIVQQAVEKPRKIPNIRTNLKFQI